jgi:hypothetical protein
MALRCGIQENVPRYGICASFRAITLANQRAAASGINSFAEVFRPLQGECGLRRHESLVLPGIAELC